MIRIAITQRLIMVGEHKELRDSLSLDWSQWLASLGALVLPLPNLVDKVDDILSKFCPDLIILSNGEDFALDANGDFDHNACNQRDHTELATLQWAIEQQVPLLGVCRGCQFINVSFGGRQMSVTGHVALNHQVDCHFPFYKGAREVNSYHQFGLLPDLSQLTPLAMTTSKQTEAFVHKQHKVAGIMWHPEREYLSHQNQDDFHQELIHWMLKL